MMQYAIKTMQDGVFVFFYSILAFGNARITL